MPSTKQSGSDSLATKPSGSDNLAKQRVADIQRARILSAMAQIASEQGLAGATVARVVARAGVSRRTYYELFEDREACFLAALDDAMACVSARVLPAYQAGDGWAEGLRLGLTALLSFLDQEPSVGQLLIVESLGAGSQGLKRRQRVLAQLADAVELGRNQANGMSGPPPLSAEGVVGAVFSIVHTRMLDGRRPLVELVGPLMGMIVLPYLGPAAARKELERPVPATSRDEGVPRDSDPLRDLGMRLTYRTVRVLLAVAANSESSNRVIADAAGISDQGQISKLLMRLRDLGLVENRCVESARGEPNAWVLTRKGSEVHGAFKARGLGDADGHS